MFLCGSFFGGSSTLFCVSAWDALCMVGSAWDALSGSLEVYGIHLGEVVGYQTYCVGPVPTCYDEVRRRYVEVRRTTSYKLILSLETDLSCIPLGIRLVCTLGQAWLSSIVSFVELTGLVYIVYNPVHYYSEIHY